MKKLFIVGCGRSGTTTLQQALNRHSQIVIPPETGFFVAFLGHTRAGQRQHLRQINGDLQIDTPFPPRRIPRGPEAIALYEQIAGLYLRRLGREGVEYFGDKTPHHLMRLRWIHEHYPDAKIILVYRDGRDVALSMTKVSWAHPDLYVNFAYWLRCCRLGEKALGLLSPRIAPVSYEDLVTDPERELRRIAVFLGVAYEPQMAEGQGNREGVAAREYGWKMHAFEKINPGRVGVWRQELTAEQAGNLERWGGTTLRTLGYELVTEAGPGRLPLTLLLEVHSRLYAWRVRWALRMATKNLFGM